MRALLAMTLLLTACATSTDDGEDTTDTSDTSDTSDTGTTDPPPLAGCTVIISEDLNADEAPDRTYTTVYGECGKPSRSDQDLRRSDGVVDKVIKYTYNAACNVTLEEQDDQANGSIDWKKTSAYDAEGRLSLEEIFPGGSKNHTNTYVYDTESGLLHQIVEWDAQGADYTHTFTYNDSEQKIRMDSDEGPDGRFDRKSFFSWSGGKIVKEEVDEPIGDPIETVKLFTYDGEGNLSTESFDRPADGVPEWTQVWTYDSENRPILMEKLEAAVVDARTEWTWDCPND